MNDPDVSIGHQVAVVLQKQGAGGAFLLVQRPTRDARKLHVIVDHDAVLEHGHPHRLHYLPGVVEPGRAEDDIVRLPLPRREARVDQCFGSAIPSGLMVLR